MSPILVSPHSQKSTKIFHGDDFFSLAEASRDQQKLSTKKKICLLAHIPTSPKSHLYCLFPPASLEQFLRDI